MQSVFSPEGIRKGSFDKYVETNGEKHGTAGVDEKFLEDIENWRLLLARNIALRNLSLTQEEINSAVQLIIDRIIFLRICEDRGIEKYETLHQLTEGEGIYSRLCGQFQRADDKYNSGLFHFSEEPGRDEMPDTLTPGLVIDDNVLKTYHPPALLPGEPVRVLGDPDRDPRARVRAVPRQGDPAHGCAPGGRGGQTGGAQGRRVFYTPSYIVEYIVKKTRR